MPDIPTIEPEEITAGDYVQWKISSSDYPASTYTLTYALVKAGALIEITAAASGDDHLVTLSAATTAEYTAGDYHWQAYMTAGSERYAVDNGTVTIHPNFAAVGADVGYDARTHEVKILEALEAFMEGRAATAQMNKIIAGEAIALMDNNQLLRWYHIYKGRVAQQRRTEARKNGKGHDGNVLVRFN